MSNKNIVILDGSGNDDDYLASPFSSLIDLFEHNNNDVRCYHLKEIKLAPGHHTKRHNHPFYPGDLWRVFIYTQNSC
jgi:hypothetical protein